MKAVIASILQTDRQRLAPPPLRLAGSEVVIVNSGTLPKFPQFHLDETYIISWPSQASLPSTGEYFYLG